MFQFNFSNETIEEENIEECKDNNKWYECEEIKPVHFAQIECLKLNTFQSGDHVIKYVGCEEVFNILKNHDNSSELLLNAEQSHSDLVTGVYEGGLKVWECTYDLLNFIHNNSLVLCKKNILDLGCGSGLIGIFSCLQGAAVTYFQDYNTQVIKFVTGVNVKLNNIPFDNCKFYGGDWESFLEILKSILSEETKFDYIFTSETIYNVSSYVKLVNIFKHLLKKNGIIYLAAKYHYFGVGGGIRQFEDMLQKEDIFNYSTAWLCSEGVKRAIIKITLK